MCLETDLKSILMCTVRLNLKIVLLNLKIKRNPKIPQLFVLPLPLPLPLLLVVFNTVSFNNPCMRYIISYDINFLRYDTSISLIGLIR